MKSLIKKILRESEDEIKFSVGDRVIVNEGNIILNEIGTIVDIDIDNDEPNIIHYIVEFDTWNKGHSAESDVCKKPGHCWWVEVKDIELAPDTYSMMDKLYEAKKLTKTKYSYLADSNLIGLKFRLDDKTYTIVENVNEYGYLIITYPSFYKGKIKTSSYKLTDLINRLNSGFLTLIPSDIKESEEDDLEWARDVVSNTFTNIEVGDVFYIVDDNAGKNILPWSHRPNDVRYIVTIVETGPDWVKKITCNPHDVTYNKSDYDPNNVVYRNNDISKVDLDWALELIGMAYWRRM